MTNKQLFKTILLHWVIFMSVVLMADVVAKVCTRLPQPLDLPGAGTYGSAQTVTLSDTVSGSLICYTTNGSDPTAAGGSCTNGTTYSTGFSVSTTSTVKAIACKSPNWSCSTLLSSLYTISGAVPTLNNTTSDTDGGSTSMTSSFSMTAGRNFVLAVASAANADFTCTDNKTPNVYTADINSINTAATPDIRIKVFHSYNTTGSGTVTITCAAATTPTFWLYEVSNISGLAATSAGTNPSADISNGNTNVAPAGFTTSDANAFLMSFFADTTGSTITATAGNSFTERGTKCVTGATCFVSGSATREVTSTGAYTDGWTLSAATDRSSIFIAYK